MRGEDVFEVRKQRLERRMEQWNSVRVRVRVGCVLGFPYWKASLGSGEDTTHGYKWLLGEVKT